MQCQLWGEAAISLLERIIRGPNIGRYRFLYGFRQLGQTAVWDSACGCKCTYFSLARAAILFPAIHLTKGTRSRKMRCLIDVSDEGGSLCEGLDHCPC